MKRKHCLEHLFQIWLAFSLSRILLLGWSHKNITPVLSELHWLPVRQRISFKIATVTLSAPVSAAILSCISHPKICTICLPVQLFLLLEELSNITYSYSLTPTVAQNLVWSNQLSLSRFVTKRQLLPSHSLETPCRPSKGIPSERIRLVEVNNFA